MEVNDESISLGVPTSTVLHRFGVENTLYKHQHQGDTQRFTSSLPESSHQRRISLSRPRLGSEEKINEKPPE